MGRPDLIAFAGTVVHELRTPLSVVSGEVDLALARERSPAAYREALMRIGERVAELVDLTTDFALLGDARHLPAATEGSATLQLVFSALADRYGPRRGSPVHFDVEGPYRRVLGEEALLSGALALLVEHAVRHRRDGSRVRLRALPPDETGDRGPQLTLDAQAAGFSTATWQVLSERPRGEPLAHGQLRLETAARIIHACGGSVDVGFEEGSECVRIGLAPATVGAEPGSGEETR